MDPRSEDLLSNTSTMLLDDTCYLSEDGVSENIHPYVFVTKTQAHIINTCNTYTSSHHFYSKSRSKEEALVGNNMAKH